MVAVGHVNPKQDDSDWKFQTYMGTNLSCDMLCEPKKLDNEDKEGDNLSSNHIIIFKKLTTKTDSF